MKIKNNANFEEKLTCHFKFEMRIWWILTRALESLKYFQCNLTNSFWAEYITFDLRKYRGVIFHDTDEWFKLLRKTDFFGKWHEEYCIFLSEHSKVSKLVLWWGFHQKHKMHDLQI